MIGKALTLESAVQIRKIENRGLFFNLDFYKYILLFRKLSVTL